MSSPKKNTGPRFAGRRLVLLQDLALSTAASLLSVLMVRWLSDPIPHFSAVVWSWLAFALGGIVAGGWISRLWRSDIRYLNVRSIGTLAIAVIFKEGVLALTLLCGIIRLPSPTLAFLAVASDFLLTGGMLLAPRCILATLRREERAVGRNLANELKTALVAGTSPSSVAMASWAESSGRYHVVGFISTALDHAGMVLDGRIVYYCNDAGDLYALQWRLGGVDSILFPTDWDMRKKEFANHAEETPKPENSPMTLLGYGFKRAFDIGLSSALLIVFSPLMGLCALAILREDGKPVIYRQERIGKGGRPFNILKFRSMYTNAEAGRPQLYSGEDDPRLTKVGKFLRQHHLDELPQLWNVLRGDMSFIGYRPERQFYIDQIMERNPRYRYLYQIRPGVTSYATLYNGYTDTLEKMLTRLDLDLYYLRNHSVLFDTKVLGLTFLKIISGKLF